MFSNKIQEIINSEQQNSDLHSTVDIPTLLNISHNVDLDFLNNQTFNTIAEDNVNALRSLGMSDNNIHSLCNKLIEYRHVDQVYQIHKGKHIRWVRNDKLTNGGIVVDVKFLDNGTHILCKSRARFIQYKLDDCLTFQRLSNDEILILQLKNS
jgi:hypothetical protein